MTEWLEKPHIIDGTRCWCKDRAGRLNLHAYPLDPQPVQEEEK